MPVGLGPRFLIEAGFLIAVAVIAGVKRFSTITIVLVMAAAWVLVAAVEWSAARFRRARTVRAALPAAGNPHGARAEPPAWTEPQRLDVEPERVAQQPAPQPPPEPEVTPTPTPEPERERPPVPEQPPAPPPSEPVPSQPRVAVVSPPAVPPEPVVRVPQQPQVVSLAARSGVPREWNLWDLERLARESAGGDAARDEERGYVLMYLREFANADGILPAEFDAVVRESFADVLDRVHT